MNSEKIDFLKKYIKTSLTKYIWPLLSDFNTQSKCKAVITGGDSIFYYVKDPDIITKDFDIKFVYHDFRDWKYFYEQEERVSKEDLRKKLLEFYKHMISTRRNFVHKVLNLLEGKERISRNLRKINFDYRDNMNEKYTLLKDIESGIFKEITLLFLLII